MTAKRRRFGRIRRLPSGRFQARYQLGDGRLPVDEREVVGVRHAVCKRKAALRPILGDGVLRAHERDPGADLESVREKINIP